MKHRFSEDQVLELKAYWKDMFDYETSQTIKPSNPKYAHLSFNMYFNADYARSRHRGNTKKVGFLQIGTSI